MMPAIGIRDLHNRTTEVMRRVREDEEEFVVTYQGRPVALLIPIVPEQVEAAMVREAKRATVSAWERYAQTADELRKRWPREKKSGDALDEIRR